ncbi:MAG: precorrin-3B C(17)-methyltransferase [Cognatishimia activa]|uniref:Precorrin-3B C(17)-methyltransferase n=1 Tax=Cognatishimia activa TaxID=1715691 RepID=A0A975EQ14_9RHOB|nr:precorrin-3B C(17)-methyltransferase [Cognatishimia activa]QTN36181.1 precorrin-3B C(17)-methyltransferase [Cognatishimia activa]
MSGSVVIAGLGPGNDALVTPEVTEALAKATDIVGYIPYVARVAERPGLTLHPSDNRVEIDRSRHALEMASEGKHVVVVSSGDPGVFAMAAAVLEAVEHGEPAWRDIDIQILPGITAMLAASAACGAPLGHDFCAINLSDNMKPWDLIEKRLRLAAEADFAMAFYNPRSKSRPEGFGKAVKALQEACGDDRPMIFARNVSRPDQTIKIVPLTEVTEDMADMRTVVLLGNSQTRLIERCNADPLIYTPRSVEG